MPSQIPNDTAPGSTSPGGAGQRAILLVDDEDGVRNFTRQVLEQAGYTVIPAADADEAEQLFRADPGQVALVLTDVLMPGRTGAELAQSLWGVRPDLSVIFLSGFTGGPRVLPTGATLIEKPFGPERLLAAVRQSIGPPG